MAGDVLGVPLQKKAYVKEDTEAGDVVGGFLFDGKYKWLEGNPAEIVSAELDYLNMSPWAWYLKDNWLSMGLGKGSDDIERTLVVTPPDEDNHQRLYLAWKPANEWSWQSKPVLSAGSDIESITAWTEDYCSKRGNPTFAKKARQWRKEAPTEAQIKYAKKLKIKIPKNCKKGELAQSITHFLAVNAVNSYL